VTQPRRLGGGRDPSSAVLGGVLFVLMTVSAALAYKLAGSGITRSRPG
jgi:hypothetical protein